MRRIYESRDIDLTACPASSASLLGTKLHRRISDNDRHPFTASIRLYAA